MRESDLLQSHLLLKFSRHDSLDSQKVTFLIIAMTLSIKNEEI